MKYTETILSNSTLKLLWFEITKLLIAVREKSFIMSFIIIFGTLSFPHTCSHIRRRSVLFAAPRRSIAHFAVLFLSISLLLHGSWKAGLCSQT